MGTIYAFVAVMTLFESPTPFKPNEFEPYYASAAFRRVLDDPLAMAIARQIAVNEHVLEMYDPPRPGLAIKPERWLTQIHQRYLSCKGCPPFVEVKRFPFTYMQARGLAGQNVLYLSNAKAQRRNHPEEAEKWQAQITAAKQAEPILLELMEAANEEGGGTVARRRVALKRLKEMLSENQWQTGTVPQPWLNDK